MSKRDYYKILGINKSSGEREIKSAYRRLAVKYHPDKNPNDRQAEEKFKEAAEAYAVLSDPQKRAQYDRYGHSGLGGPGFDPGFTNIEDIFDLFGFGDMFGSRRSRRSGARRGADLRYDFEIKLEEAALGKDAKIKIPRLETCDECDGKGASAESSSETCVTCKGDGQTRYQQGFFSVMRTCPNCGGKGEIIKSPCKSCLGTGRVERHKSLEVKIPAGVKTGSQLRIDGEGEAGIGGGRSGDLYIVIHVTEHENFERQGANLYTSVPISFTQAALGADIKVKTLYGVEELKIPAGTQTGTVFRIKGNGVPSLSGRGKGDLYVAVTLVTPKALSQEQRKIIEKLAEIENVDFQEEGFMNKVRNIFS